MSSDATLKIPRKLYKKLKELIQDTGFKSVTEFVKFVLRDLASQGEFKDAEELNGDMKKVRERLEKLGYLDR